MVVISTLMAPILLRWVLSAQPEVLTEKTAERFTEIEEAIGAKFEDVS